MSDSQSAVRPCYRARSWNERFRPISRRKREKELEFAISELTHRSKNMLAIIQAMATLSGRNSKSVQDFQSLFSKRLKCISQSIDVISGKDNQAAPIHELVQRQLATFGGVDGVRICARGPCVLLTSDAAQNIGLALHELATNALKYGSLSVPEGFVTLDWELETGAFGTPYFRMFWRECNGPEVSHPTKRGFGESVLQRIVGQSLQGKAAHDFCLSGVNWTLEVPAAVISVTQSTSNIEKRTHAHSST